MTAPHSISSGSIWPLIEAYVDACGHRAMDSTRIPEMESARRRLEEVLGAAQGVPEPEAYRETVRQIAAVREKRMAEMREALERIRNFPHDKTACEQAMSQIAGEALAMSSTPQKTPGRTDREGGWNAARGLSVTSTQDRSAAK